ncbi:hypothetical protein PoB_005390400 [Plakobranchus ocellatus]|uniref:Uncharacterized protein n=1 Tax=Plakobranchus ocellatus TaxID=259542 RepID=A0AAV4C8K1_9GAST|nr:hypothetical protein PoB_005390400 [Plakobranchus ocellatus]
MFATRQEDEIIVTLTNDVVLNLSNNKLNDDWSTSYSSYSSLPHFNLGNNIGLSKLVHHEMTSGLQALSQAAIEELLQISERLRYSLFTVSPAHLNK